MKNYNSWNNIPRSNKKRSVKNFNYQTLKDSKNYLPRGLGRSYGDVCLNDDGDLVLTEKFDKVLSFDEQNGLIECEAGISINQLLKIITPTGWFLPVVPGTSYVSLGGAIANDIHGKNHHKVGSFGNNLISFEILCSDGDILKCSKTENTNLFYATIGGLGLTGIIVNVKIQLIKVASNLIDVGSKRFFSLDEFFKLNNEYEELYDYTVSWVDFDIKNKGSIRGVYHYGNHSSNGYQKDSNFSITFPIKLPFSIVNNLTLKILNNFYFYANKDKNLKKQHYRSFFFPLDAIKNWNRAYGRKGFFQYQFVVPKRESKEVVGLVIDKLIKYKQKPALGVLKTFGEKQPLGMLSFPREGLTLAIDLQNKGTSTLELLNELDNVINSFNGRIYPAKDSRMSKETFLNNYTEYEKFKSYIDPKINSNFITRLGV